jgi:membrane protein
MKAETKTGVFRQAVNDFIADDALTLAGALAFYAALSLAPLLMIMLWITSFLGPDTQQAMIGQVEQAVGPQAGEGIEMVLQNAGEQPTAGNVAGIIGICMLLFSASAVFAQLQYSLNMIWGVQRKGGVGGWLKKRLMSILLIFGIFAIFLASMVAGAVLSGMFGASGILWQALELGISAAVFVALFGLIFHVLPDVKIKWKHVWVGAIATALLFTLGRWGIGLYLGQAGVGSPYGAAGSLVVLLVWVYYSSLILFFGAELTQAYARHSGDAITPSEQAEWRPGARNAPKDEDEQAEPRRQQLREARGRSETTDWKPSNEPDLHQRQTTT